MAGVKNIHQESKAIIKLGDTEVKLDYTLASFAYLTEKHGDLGELFASVSMQGKEVKQLLSKDYLDAIVDMIYAGVMKPDADKLQQGASFAEADTSGWNIYKIYTSIHLNEIGAIGEAINAAMAASVTDPTQAAAKAADK
jgi:hypothetical protein